MSMLTMGQQQERAGEKVVGSAAPTTISQSSRVFNSVPSSSVASVHAATVGSDRKPNEGSREQARYQTIKRNSAHIQKIAPRTSSIRAEIPPPALTPPRYYQGATQQMASRPQTNFAGQQQQRLIASTPPGWVPRNQWPVDGRNTFQQTFRPMPVPCELSHEQKTKRRRLERPTEPFPGQHPLASTTFPSTQRYFHSYPNNRTTPAFNGAGPPFTSPNNAWTDGWSSWSKAQIEKYQTCKRLSLEPATFSHGLLFIPVASPLVTLASNYNGVDFPTLSFFDQILLSSVEAFFMAPQAGSRHKCEFPEPKTGIRCCFCRPVPFELQTGNVGHKFNFQYFFPVNDEAIIYGLRQFMTNHLLGTGDHQCIAIPKHTRQLLQTSTNFGKVQFDARVIRQLFLSLLRDGNFGMGETQRHSQRPGPFGTMRRNPDVTVAFSARQQCEAQKRLPSNDLGQKKGFDNGLVPVINVDEDDSSASDNTDDEALMSQWEKQIVTNHDTSLELGFNPVIDHAGIFEASAWGLMSQGFFDTSDRLQAGAARFPFIRDMLIPGSLAYLFCETFSSFAVSGNPALNLFLSGTSEFCKVVLQNTELVRIAKKDELGNESDDNDDDRTNPRGFDPDGKIGIRCLHCGSNPGRCALVAVRPLGALGRFIHNMAHEHLFRCDAVQPQKRAALKHALYSNSPRYGEDRAQLLSCGDVIVRGLRKKKFDSLAKTLEQPPKLAVATPEDQFYSVTKLEKLAPWKKWNDCVCNTSSIKKCVEEESGPDGLVEKRYLNQMAIQSRSFAEQMQWKNKWGRSLATLKKNEQPIGDNKMIFDLEVAT